MKSDEINVMLQDGLKGSQITLGFMGNDNSGVKK